MLWGRKQHETAMERFVGLLAEAGITVEPYDDEGSTEYAQQQAQAERDLQNSFERHRLGSRDGRNGVLSSAETLHGEDDAPQSLQKGSTGHRLGLQDTHTQPFRRHTRRSRSEDTHKRGIPGLERGRVNGRVASAQLPARTRRRRDGSVSSIRSLRIQRTRNFTLQGGSAYSADESDSSEPTQSRRHSISEAAVPTPISGLHDARSFLPPELLLRSEEQLDAIAETFMETKDRILQRRTIMRWSQQANQAKAGHDQLYLLAQNVDRTNLLKETWLVWHGQLDAKRLEREWQAKEGLYRALEETAARERDFNLKWVALSHWRTITEEEKQRTSIARRHIMRKRYFAAWSNITALNDVKIRRFVLTRFFDKWQQRMEHVREQHLEAQTRYETKLVEGAYKLWFYAFLDKTAPEFHDRKLEKRFFANWRTKLYERVHQDDLAADHCLSGVERSRLLAWRDKARDLMDMNRAAETFQKQRLRVILENWKREALLAPRAAQVVQHVEGRMRSTFFSMWHTRTLQSRQAQETDRQRVLRNAFTAWNDRVRMNFLQGQINIRLKMDALYKWRIASRSNAAEWEHERRLVHTMLGQWLSKAQNRHRSIEGAEQTYEASRRRRTLQQAFGKLTSSYLYQQDLEAEAQHFHRTRLLHGAFSKWQQKSDDVDLLYRKAGAAEFYILTKKSLKRWSHSTEEHRKYRKREAYSHIRRLTKMNLAREMLRRMQIELAHIRNMDHYSLEFQEDQVVKNTTSMFRSWKQRAVVSLEQERRAREYYNRKLSVAVLQKMVQRKNQLQGMSAQARELSAGSAGVEAMNCFRKLDRRLFQVKGQEQWASALREKHWEKHVKNMLRYWLEQTVAAQRGRLDAGGEQDIFRASTATAPALGDLTVFDNTAWNLDPLDLDLNTFANTAQAEVDATFMDNDGIITSTPMPGYLRTPSKRNTARAKARERLAANIPAPTGRTIRFADQVTASAPPRQQTISAPPVLASPAQSSITPFERRLREQGYTSPSRSGRRMRGAIGANRFGVSVGSGRFGSNTPARSAFAGFEDIPEVSEERSRGF